MKLLAFLFEQPSYVILKVDIIKVPKHTILVKTDSSATGHIGVYGDLVYHFERIFGKIKQTMRQIACLVINQITIYRYGSMFNCTAKGQALYSMMTLT